MEPFIGMIILFAGNFAPRGWALCDGQLLPISTYQALFSILGTTYGGDGRTTFALPDLRGRVPMHMGTGPGLSNRRLGQKLGEQTVTLSASQVPLQAHSHLFNVSTGAPQDDTPGGQYFGTAELFTSSSNTAQLNPGTIASAGGGAAATPVDLEQPSLVLNYIIALQGIFPSRS